MAAGSGAVAQLTTLAGDVLKAVWFWVAIVILAGLLGAGVHAIVGSKPNAAVAKADTVVQHADTVFIHDTARVAVVRNLYRTLRNSVVRDSGRVAPDTVLRLVQLSDTVTAVDSTAIENCARLVEAQRKLIATLQPPPPRLQYFVEPLYSVTDGAIDVRGGAEYRVFGSVSAIAAAQVGPNPGLFVGARITFR